MVLVRPNYCGWPPHNHNEDNLIEALSLYVPGIRIFENSRAYAQKCYGLTAGPNGASCSSFVKPALERTIQRDVDCPFSPSICESKGITLTSGYIDSHEDLGINAAPEDRIRFKKFLSCAVLNAESDYSSGWVVQPAELQNISNPLYQSPGVAFKLYFLGSQIIQGVPAPYSFYVSNISSTRSGYQHNVSRPHMSNASHFDHSNRVFADSTSEHVDGYSFKPRPELWKDDSLVFLWVLENKVAYTGPVNDPWFKATTPGLNGNTEVCRRQTRQQG